jgi:hypothetical protein
MLMKDEARRIAANVAKLAAVCYGGRIVGAGDAVSVAHLLGPPLPPVPEAAPQSFVAAFCASVWDL